MPEHGQRKALLCRLGVHRWVTRTNAGARWQECSRCGRYSNKVTTMNRFPPGGTGDGTGGM